MQLPSFLEPLSNLTPVISSTLRRHCPNDHFIPSRPGYCCKIHMNLGTCGVVRRIRGRNIIRKREKGDLVRRFSRICERKRMSSPCETPDKSKRHLRQLRHSLLQKFSPLSFSHTLLQACFATVMHFYYATTTAAPLLSVSHASMER